MRLQRNTVPGRANKYALIRMDDIDTERENSAHIRRALQTLRDANLIDFGNTPDSEFFVIRLKDVNAAPALAAYAMNAQKFDPEFAKDVAELAIRAEKHPSKKLPD